MLNFFGVKTIALIGASNEEKSVGRGIASNLLKSKKKVFFVNPFKDKVLGIKTYKSVLDIKERVDLVVIAVPAKVVIGVAKECKQKKVGAVIVVSAGFGEVGNKKLEEDLIKELGGIPLIGPNCLGIIGEDFNASFAPFNPKKGNIAFLSQSGATLDAILDLSQGEQYGFSKIISYGNEADLKLVDYLEYLNKDKNTRVIMVYLEGIKDGKRFLKTVSKIKKPIIVLRSGKSNLGRKTALTHTGSLSGDNEIYDAVFEQLNIIQVDSIEELLDTAKALSWLDRCKNGLGIITNGGGMGVLATDYAEKYGIIVPELVNKKELAREEMKIVTKKNPLDVIGDALSNRYEIGMKALLEQKNIHSVLVIQGRQIMTEAEENAKIAVKMAKKFLHKPIVCCFVGRFEKAKEIAEKNNIPVFNDPLKAVKVLKNLINE